MITAYLCQHCFGLKIEKIEVTRTTNVSYWTLDRNGKERRHKRFTDYEAYFDTFDGAKEFLTKKAENRLQSARAKVATATRELGNVLALKKD